MKQQQRCQYTEAMKLPEAFPHIFWDHTWSSVSSSPAWETRNYWIESNEEPWRWWGDWSTSLTRRGQETWGCLARRRADSQWVFSMLISIDADSHAGEGNTQVLIVQPTNNKAAFSLFFAVLTMFPHPRAAGWCRAELWH